MELPQNQSPIASGGQMPLPPDPQKGGIGPIVGAIVVIFLLAAGGLYFWGAKLNEQAMLEESVPYIPSEEVPPAGESDSSAGLPPQSESDESAAIESDLQAMDFEQFDSQTEADINNFDEETR